MKRDHKPTGPSQRMLRVGELVRHALSGCLTRDEIEDPVLSVQLKRGFEVAGIINHYLDDPSCDTSLTAAGKLLKEFGTVNAIDCRTDNTLWVGEVGNLRVQKLTLH